MGTSKALEFLAALDRDENLAMQADDAFVESLHKVAGGAGYDFSESDLRAALDGASEGLSDQQLDQVAGGLYTTQLSSFSTSLSDPMLSSGGLVADTVYGGGTSSIANPMGPLRFGSFSKTGYTR